MRTLILSGEQVAGRGLWLSAFPRLDSLRVVSKDWSTRRMNGCARCQQAKRKDPIIRSGQFAGLGQTRRARRIEVLGLILDRKFGELLAELPFLESLNLSGCDLSELDFKKFRTMHALRHLDLSGCHGVDPKDIRQVEKLNRLSLLDLRGLDYDAARRVRAALPNCDVRF